ncbi:ABC transporter permease [Clostridium sp. AF19-22AC]|jgi:ABC-type dipeptide/oligopeptide/nickel transport system permease component|uniref:Peptide/nickel transport system permease protein n=1 Tax=Faecalicatena orotica TaxID=1544 RepID=A0A2Y9BDU6_9FIRM|nr:MULTISPECIES: ABC transporter permease [Clostridia]PWJ29896.1 peptide/nickel transport system permease protein [Faecalicatena orotica]RHR30347.1 ABC transporter permease [Clostridium sp. AF19-22AC]SSA55622.1 peptide/nickel transport system permease protein [Faecalicatena orotica]
MFRYIVKRILMMIVILWCAGVVIFTLTYLVPGDVASLMLGKEATVEVINQKRTVLGLDQPYLVQLGRYMYDTFIRLDFGDSWIFSSSVMAELAVRLPRTLLIGLSAMVLNVTIGTLLGIFAGTHEGKWQDSLVMIIAMVFISAPDFFVALLLILLFSLKLGWLPAYGIESMACYILPIISCALGGIAVNARQARSSMLEVIRADFVTTARAKGQKEKVITRKHMLPNAMMPIITGVGGGLAMVVAGSPVIESVFSIPGVGAYMLAGVNQHDYPVVRACVIFFALFCSVAILIMDLCYAFLDPRIKAQYSKGKKVK